MCSDGLGDDFGPGLRSKAGESQQEDSPGRTAQAKDEFAEVLVSSEEEARFGIGQVEHSVVGDAGRKLSDVGEVMTITAQANDSLGIDALIGKEPHATDLVRG